MDSLTCYAMAQREIALAIGEPLATKGYPPSVFAKLPSLVERTGMGAPGPNGKAGSITALHGAGRRRRSAGSDRRLGPRHSRWPRRAVSRHLAEAGHYPAIDIEASISRP